MIANRNEASRETARTTAENGAPAVKDRIRRFVRVKAAELKPHPCNWRLHPPEQRAALEAMLAEIGYAGALVARELPDGSLQLIDGHLRAEVSPGADVPVLVVDLDDREAEKLLALHDPIAAMARAEQLVLAELSSRIETENAALRQLLGSLVANTGEFAPTNDSADDDLCGRDPVPNDGSCGGTPDGVCDERPGASAERRPPSVEIPELYQLVVECRDLCEQEELFDRLTAEGYSCRVVNTAVESRAKVAGDADADN